MELFFIFCIYFKVERRKQPVTLEPLSNTRPEHYFCEIISNKKGVHTRADSCCHIRLVNKAIQSNSLMKYHLLLLICQCALCLSKRARQYFQILFSYENFIFNYFPRDFVLTLGSNGLVTWHSCNVFGKLCGQSLLLLRR